MERSQRWTCCIFVATSSTVFTSVKRRLESNLKCWSLQKDAKIRNMHTTADNHAKPRTTKKSNIKTSLPKQAFPTRPERIFQKLIVESDTWGHHCSQKLRVLNIIILKWHHLQQSGDRHRIALNNSKHVRRSKDIICVVVTCQASIALQVSLSLSTVAAPFLWFGSIHLCRTATARGRITELLSEPLLSLNAIQHLRSPIAFSTFGVLRIWGYRSIVLYTWALTVFFMWILLHPQCMRSCYCHCC